MDEKIEMETYSMRFYYPYMNLTEFDDEVHNFRYLLSVPKPIGQEQMELLLKLISQMRPCNEHMSDRVTMRGTVKR